MPSMRCAPSRYWPGRRCRPPALNCGAASGSSGRRAPSACRRQLALAGYGVWAAVGLHPHDAKQGVESVAALLDEVVGSDDDSLVAVGECGLDYHYDHSPRPTQRDAFAAQVALAHRHGLALVVHSREAWDD